MICVKPRYEISSHTSNLVLSNRKKLSIPNFPFENTIILVLFVLTFSLKLLDNCIDEKCFRIIPNMYSKIKSCITQGNEFSDFFAYEIGVKQGEKIVYFSEIIPNLLFKTAVKTLPIQLK
jgi:hypothetical protein